MKQLVLQKKENEKLKKEITEFKKTITEYKEDEELDVDGVDEHGAAP